MNIQWMWLDWVFLGILLLSTLLAVFRGFVREAISLVSWIAAFILALLFANTVGNLLYHSVHNASVKYAISYITIFLIILAIGMLINFLIGKLVKVTGLGFFDTILGGLFGFMRGICLLVIIIMLLSMPWMSAQNVLNQSVIANLLHPVVDWAITHMPTDNDVTQKVQQINKVS